MKPKKCCLHCVRPLDAGDENFHPECLPKAKAHLDAVCDMARRKYGYDFSLRIWADGSGNPHIVDLREREASEIRTFPVAPAGSSGGKECFCEKDADGRCPSCIEVISGNTEQLLRVMLDSQRRLSELAVEEEACKACSREYKDHTFAKLARDFGRTIREDMGSKFLPVLSNIFLMMRQMVPDVREWPLLDKAIRSLKEEEEKDDAGSP